MADCQFLRRIQNLQRSKYVSVAVRDFPDYVNWDGRSHHKYEQYHYMVRVLGFKQGGQMLAKSQYYLSLLPSCGYHLTSCLSSERHALPSVMDCTLKLTVNPNKALFPYSAFLLHCATEAHHAWHLHCGLQISIWRQGSLLSAHCYPSARPWKWFPKNNALEALPQDRRCHGVKNQRCKSIREFPLKWMWQTVESGTIMKNKQTTNVWLPKLLLNILPKHFPKRN